MRSGEYWPRENASGHLGGEAGAQLLQHNPRKQREILANAGSGEQFLKGKWRRERDCRPTFSGKKPMNSIIPILRQGLSGSMTNQITTRLTGAEPNTNRFFRHRHPHRLEHPEFGLSRLHPGRVASIHPRLLWFRSFHAVMGCKWDNGRGQPCRRHQCAAGFSLTRKACSRGPRS